MRLTELIRAFAQAEEANPSHHELLYTLQRVALDVVYAENARGGEARGVVADVARILGTNIDAGPGHRWDADHMQRVVEAAEELRKERDNYKRAYELKPASLRLEGPGAERLADRLADIDDLRATIVSQAREIARLKGESA